MLKYQSYVIVACLLCLGLSSCGKADKPIALTLVFSSHLLGELEPCGCTMEGDFGGIRRQATAIEQLRQRDSHLILISGGALLDTTSVTAKIKNEYILKGFQQLKYDAIALQPRDTAFGLSLLQSVPLPWLANKSWNAQIRAERQKKLPEVSVVFYSAMNLAKAVHQPGNQTPLHEFDGKALAKQIQQRHQQHFLTVLMTDQEPTVLAQWLDLKNVDVLLIPNTNSDQYRKAEVLAHTLVIRPGKQGKQLGVLHLQWSAQQHRLLSYQQKIISLSTKVANAASMQTWYQHYNQAAKQLYQQRAQANAKWVQHPIYAGAETCGTCHLKAMTVWQSSQHSHALNALKAVNKQFDPECVGCHVVGYGQAGGFVDELLTPQLSHIQCESCHGPGLAHVQSPALQKMANLKLQAQPICLQCHNEKHSPVFDFKTYWPRIAH